MMMLLESRMWMPSWSNTAPPPVPMMVTLLISFSSILSAAVLQLSPETFVVLPWLIVPSTSMVIGVLLLARLHRAWWICVPVVARTVAPPLPPVVPPFMDAYPVGVPTAAAEASRDGSPTATAAPTAPVARAVRTRSVTDRLILASLPRQTVCGPVARRRRPTSHETGKRFPVRE
jgi:hypothetical protein